MICLRWGYCLVMVFLLAACGSPSAPAPTLSPTDDSIAPLGIWSFEYSGDCSGRDAETIDITTLGEQEIVFDEFILVKSDDGDYVGSIESIAPMPADGRDIVFETLIEISQDDSTTFSGTETITETGKGSDACPIQIVYQGGE